MTQSTMRLTVNGKTQRCRRRARHRIALCAAQRPRLERTEIRLRARRMRRLRGADRRRRRAVLRDPDRGLHRARHRDARRSRHARASRSRAAGLHPRAGRAMRLLPQRHDHRDQGAVAAFPSPVRTTRCWKRCAIISAAAARISKSCVRQCAPPAAPLRRRRDDGTRHDRGSQRLQGTLSVVRPASPVEAVKFETFIRITADGSVTAYNGHVDLGTGIRTALGQIVAEELDVSLCARRRRARRYIAGPQSGRDDRERNDPDHRRAAAQGRRAGAAVSGRACGGAAGASGRGSRRRRRPDPRQGQSQRQLWRTDRGRDHPA